MAKNDKIDGSALFAEYEKADAEIQKAQTTLVKLKAARSKVGEKIHSTLGGGPFKRKGIEVRVKKARGGNFGVYPVGSKGEIMEV